MQAVLDCPHCGTRKSALRYVAEELVAVVDDHWRRWVTLQLCQTCDGGIVITYQDDTPGNCKPSECQGDPASNGSRVVSVYPQLTTPQAPEGVPSGIASDYLEAVDNLRQKKTKSAVMMFRTVLGNATNNLLPEYTKEPIQSRIQCLVESRAITPAMGDWANVVRLAGNEVVHEAEAEISEAEAQQLEAFTRLFLEYAFTLPSQVAEWHKRRAEGADDVPDAPESDRERARVDTGHSTARRDRFSR